MATITEDYIFFKVSKLLKEKGFDEKCIYAYSETSHEKSAFHPYLLNSKSNPLMYGAPTIQMAMKWLREVHKLYITISHRFSHNADQDVCFSYYINIDTAEDGEYMTYEETCEAAIKYCLENLIK